MPLGFIFAIIMGIVAIVMGTVMHASPALRRPSISRPAPTHRAPALPASASAPVACRAGRGSTGGMNRAA